jgi:hypothetical protein
LTCKMPVLSVSFDLKKHVACPQQCLCLA